MAEPRVVVLTHSVGSRVLVAERCALAAASGVRRGMDLAHARSLLSSRIIPFVEAFCPSRHNLALAALARWTLRFAPIVAPDPPDGLLIDCTGTERVHRGEGRLIRLVASSLERIGFAARMAAASTVGCAWGVARFGPRDHSRVPAGSEHEAISRLPVAALRVDEAVVAALAEIGITEVGHLLRLPRAALAARFDDSLLRRVRQALGEIDERIDGIQPGTRWRAEVVFDGETDRWESVHAAARHVLEHVAAQLGRRQRGARRFDLRLVRSRTESPSITIHVSRHTRSVKHLWPLLRARLERMDLDRAVEGVVLTASHTARLPHEQQALFTKSDRGAASWSELVDTLAGRLGDERLCWFEPVESHLPERAYRRRPAAHPPPRWPPVASITSADRPTTLFARPEWAQEAAIASDGVLLGMAWRGRVWRIVTCEGPERIGDEWWRRRPSDPEPDGTADGLDRHRTRDSCSSTMDREYFKVQTDCGRWLWIFRCAGTSGWHVHGEWN
jgi:protein ImuB